MSKVTVLFFARLREKLPHASIEFPWTDPQSAEVLRQAIVAQGDEWAELTEGHLVAINQDMASPDNLVRPGDEVAFFPPVTGG
ncbi:MAG: MoaD/ThiS family protein [Natronospirillum sp.]